MKNLTFLLSTVLVVLVLSIKVTYSQNTNEMPVDTTVDLDMLTVPNSPAFTILGISPSDIDKPTTPADFAFSIANASSNLSQLPKNYAIEFLPLSIFSKTVKQYDSLKTNNIWSNFKQSLTLSSGFSTNDSIDTSIPGFVKTRSGIGFRVSLFRGKIDTASTFSKNIEALKRVDSLLLEVHKGNLAFIDSIRKNDTIYKTLESKRAVIAGKDTAGTGMLIHFRNSMTTGADTIRFRQMQDSLRIIWDSLKSERASINVQILERLEVVKKDKISEQTNLAAQLKKSVESIKYYRYGWLLDFAGGMVLGFRNDDFQNSIVQQYAFWLNGGYSCGSGFNILGVARYNNSIKASIDENGNKKDKSSWDFGGKLEYVSVNKNFSINGEIVGRFFGTENPTGNDTSTTKYLSRYSLNAIYQVGKNQALTFSVGKAFAGKAQYGGNLIAALNYIKTFGTKQNLAPEKLSQ